MCKTNSSRYSESYFPLLAFPQEGTSTGVTHLATILVITDYHNKISQTEYFVFAHNSGGWKSKIKVSAGLVSPKASVLGLQKTAFSLCPHMAFLPCICILGVILSSLIRTSSPTGLGPHSYELI